MKVKSIQLDAVWKKAALLVVPAVLLASSWFVMRWSVAGSAVQRVDTPELAVYLTNLGPDDPQTHSMAAIYLEKSFDEKDIERALREMEIAASLTPGNYALWLDLGRARERSGDPQGAELALRRSLALAPHYSRVQWALGNLLLRQDRIEEAFVEIRKAVSGDPAFAGPAASTAWQFFDGDVARIRAGMGSSVKFNAELAALLAREKRFDEALAIWSELPAAEKRTSLKEAGANLLAKFLEARRFRNAASVSAELNDDGAKVSSVANGGFESPVRPEGAGAFEWQLAYGLQPQIVISTGQKHGGDKSLLLVFNAQDAKDFRTVSQTIAVAPGRMYELEFFYRAELKTSAVFKWEIIDAADSKPIAASEPTEAQAEWRRVVVRFKAPDQSDGVTIRLTRDGCGQVCAVTGNLWVEDFVLREAR
ncbi:MAG TPA: tetratricopeptide repeat protein [Pyrinomonadaceae bacterium]|nr:tetratricopeptide repeat protein [Pyrinomonadaceae bacterium]